jgi:hypothetical protein
MSTQRQPALYHHRSTYERRKATLLRPGQSLDDLHQHLRRGGRLALFGGPVVRLMPRRTALLGAARLLRDGM